jgi:hypothetical protein
MTRWCALFLLAVAVTPVRAHFIWIVPDKLEEERTTVRVIFSDSLEPGSPDLLAKIARTKLSVCGRDGLPAPLDLGAGKEGARIAILEGKGPWVVVGECRYGVVRRGADKPFLLVYWPKTYVRRSASEPLPHCKEKQLLEITPVEDERAAYDVSWKGKPLPGAEVAVVALGETKAREMKTDGRGRISLAGTKGGIYGIRARHVEDVRGTEDGKPYDTVRHYATLVVELSPVTSSSAEAPPKDVPRPARVVANADPDATRLLTEARAARASWENFPGFTADVVVNLDGRTVSRGRVEVKSDGKVALELGDKDAATWARRELGSIVGHRLPGGNDSPTPCAFADDDETNPLGRAIRVLNDEYHSSYRIRDRQITVVNRAMPQAGIRFTITVLENRRNEEGNFLPVSFVVNTWDQKSNALQSSEAQHQTWVRVGKFDLPQTLLVVTAKEGKQEARSLKLSNHQLPR